MIPDAARAVIHAAVWDARRLADPHDADAIAEQVADALAKQGWTITPTRPKNAPQNAA